MKAALPRKSPNTSPAPAAKSNSYSPSAAEPVGANLVFALHSREEGEHKVRPYGAPACYFACPTSHSITLGYASSSV